MTGSNSTNRIGRTICKGWIRTDSLFYFLRGKPQHRKKAEHWSDQWVRNECKVQDLKKKKKKEKRRRRKEEGESEEEEEVRNNDDWCIRFNHELRRLRKELSIVDYIRQSLWQTKHSNTLLLLSIIFSHINVEILQSLPILSSILGETFNLS